MKERCYAIKSRQGLDAVSSVMCKVSHIPSIEVQGLSFLYLTLGSRAHPHLPSH